MAWNKPLDWTLSVSDLNEYVRKTLASDPILRSVKLKGEISGLKRHVSGHLYFTLKDENARIAAVMFRQQATALDFTPKDGQQVIAEGSVSLYPAAGQYQFYAERMRPDGQGDLFARFERLKAKLLAEGLFDAALKKPLPMYPRRVGIITSPTGAVIHDIQTVAARRNPTVALTLCPVNVQGGAAAGEIARAIARMDALNFDVLIVGRGGGSLEDLWAFNEEIVARAIFACHTPIISAVGHEVDFTIADFVADVRAATPSVAAELAIADRAELARLIDARLTRLNRAHENKLNACDARVAQVCARLEAQNPAKRVELAGVRLDALALRLRAAGDAYVDARFGRLRELSATLIAKSPLPTIDADAQRLRQLDMRLKSAAQRGIELRERELAGLRGKLAALDPDGVLRRGYAIVTVGGAIVPDAQRVQPGDMLGVRMRDGTITALTIEISDAAKAEG